MKVKAIIVFNDNEENVKRQIGDVFNCTKERADYLLENNAIEILEDGTTEHPYTEVEELTFEEEKPKKRKRRKTKKE